MNLVKFLLLGAITVIPLALQAMPAAGAEAASELPTDHSAVVGHWGIGYLGSSQVSVLAQKPDESNPLPLSPVDLHSVGVRYWMSPKVGVEFGAAVGTGMASTSISKGNTTSTEESPGYLAFEVQAGLPVIVAETRHLAFHIAPFLAYRRASSSLTVTTGSDSAGIKLTDQTFQAGANLTAEWQFGFIGLPELGLQARLGVAVVRQAVGIALSSNGTVVSEYERATTRFGTSVGSEGDVAGQVLGHLAAVWYFGAGR